MRKDPTGGDPEGRSEELPVPATPRFVCRPDLLREHADVERAGWLVLVNVLTVGLVALNEIFRGLSEPVRSMETDPDRFRYHLAQELPCTIPSHAIRFLHHPPAGQIIV